MLSKSRLISLSRRLALSHFKNTEPIRHTHATAPASTNLLTSSWNSSSFGNLKRENFVRKASLPRLSSSRKMSQSKVVVDQYNISYYKVGSGPHALLLLPGALGTGQGDFGPQLSGFDPEVFTIIAWDPPGYGESRPPDRSWPEDFFQRDADCAAKLMGELGYEKYSMLGWSDGGITGLIIAAQYAKNINRFVLFGANAFFGHDDIELLSKVKDVSNWSARMREPLEKTYGVEGFPKLWQEWNGAVEWYAKNRDGDVCKTMLKDIVCPTLIIHGAKDAMVAPIHPVYLRENIADAKYYEFPDGKHNLHFKYAAEFNKVATEFLVNTPSSSL